jgi:hypothetical protein
MTEKARLNPNEVRRAATDFVVIPVILFWALLSCGPFVGLVRIAEPFRYGLNVAFLATSLWGVLAGAIFLKSLMWSDMRFRSGLGINRAYLAAGGAVWCVFYLIFVMTPR